MLADINSFFQTISILIGMFLVERYILLEPAMEPKKQRLFYILTFCISTVLFFINKDAAPLVTALLGGLNISLGRKKRRVIGFALIIPLTGLLNGSMAALLNLSAIIAAGIDNRETTQQIAATLTYTIIFALLAVFYFKGKKWRKWFAENTYGRSLNRDEYIMVLAAGSLMLIFSFLFVLFGPADMSEIQNDAHGTTLIMCAYCILSCTLSITIIVMVMQGNRRKFYYDKVEKMQFSVISTMADIVENRDANTGGHIKRTAKYVEIIGKKLQSLKLFPETLTDSYLSDMIVAAPLHDIGKIHIPDAVLNKPGRLTDEEFAIMKTHAAAGRDVLLKAKTQLGDFDYINTAIEMAEYHHEWWNGKGYPNGISGEEIPLCARIMAVADVFDALTAKRCYKAAMPLEKAYEIITNETGTHFDPAVARAFLSSKEEVEAALTELSLEEE